MEYGADLRYPSTNGSISNDNLQGHRTPAPGAQGQGSVGDYFSGFAELEAVEAVLNDGFTTAHALPRRTNPTNPVIADPRGTEMIRPMCSMPDPAGVVADASAGRQGNHAYNGRFYQATQA